MTESECKRFSDALAFAAEKHAEQRRRNGDPYILHPVKVAMHLAKDGYDVRYQIAGLFHDLLEDTDATEDELRKFCDEEMMTAIKLVTKTAGFVEDEYLSAILKNPMAKAVKNADRIDNLSDLPNQDDEKFTARYMLDTKTHFVGRFSEELDKLFYDLEKHTL